MITQLGIVAGDIWHFLDKQKDVKLSNLIKDLDKPRDIILMSIGWLSREGHIVLEGEAPDYQVSLRQAEEKV